LNDLTALKLEKLSLFGTMKLGCCFLSTPFVLKDHPIKGHLPWFHPAGTHPENAAWAGKSVRKIPHDIHEKSLCWIISEAMVSKASG
jgi:hypothetical protein